MQIFATFESSIFLEMVLSELKERGVTDIYAVPLNLRKEQARIMDNLHRADGVSFIDKGFVLAFLLSTIGASKGFVWTWGPVIWGLIGAATGFVAGILIDLLLYAVKYKRNRHRISRGKGEVILIVNCLEGQASVIEDLLWDHKALGLARTR